MADSEKLCRLVSEFGRVCERRKLRVNVGKSKVMRYVRLNGEPLEEVDCLSTWSGCERNVVHGINEGYRPCEALKGGLNNRGYVLLFIFKCEDWLINAMKCLYEGISVPTALYGAEAWGMRSAEIRQVNVLETKCLRSLVGVSRIDTVRNEEVRKSASI